MFKLGFSAIPTWVKLAAILAVCAVAFGGGYKLANLQRDSLELEAAKILAQEVARVNEDNRIARDDLAHVSKELEEALATQREVVRYVTRKVEVEIEKPVYRECIVPADGVRIRAEAAASFNAARSAGKSQD